MAHEDYLGEWEQIVLLAVLRCGDRAYGVPVREEIRVCTGRAVAPGALYTTLDRLENKGLLLSRMGEPTPVRGGRARRFYCVTRQGREAVARAQTAYLQLLQGLDLLEEGA